MNTITLDNKVMERYEQYGSLSYTTVPDSELPNTKPIAREGVMVTLPFYDDFPSRSIIKTTFVSDGSDPINLNLNSNKNGIGLESHKLLNSYVVPLMGTEETITIVYTKRMKTGVPLRIIRMISTPNFVLMEYDGNFIDISHVLAAD